MLLSGIHNSNQLEAGFPIKIASGMTVLGTGGRLTLIRIKKQKKDIDKAVGLSYIAKSAAALGL